MADAPTSVALGLLLGATQPEAAAAATTSEAETSATAAGQNSPAPAALYSPTIGGDSAGGTGRGRTKAMESSGPMAEAVA